MGYALIEEFIGTKGVTPVSENQGSQNETGKGAPELTKVSYPDLWPGITLNYEQKKGGVSETTYIINPKADASKIRIKYNASATVQKDGTLRFKHPTEMGYFTMSAPIAWQEIEGKRIKVAVAFNDYGKNVIGFKVGDYDKNHALIIDPTLTWNTFLGGSGNDGGYSIAVDGSGNVYVAGYSDATWGTPVRAYGGGTGDAITVKISDPQPTTPVSVPTMTEWGMIIFMVLAGFGAIYCLRRHGRV